MILTCPECATAYFVDESRIGANGRPVRCTSCRAIWTAKPEMAEDPEPRAPSDAMDFEALLASQAQPEPEPELVEEPEAEAPAPTADDLPKSFRAKADTQRRMKEAAAVGAVWAGMAAVLTAVVAVALVFRVDAVRLWPKSAGAYASVGLPVNSLGLAIENVAAEPSLQDGHAALAVTGTIRNVEDHTVVAPPLRISLLTADGKPISAKIARASDPRIPPGETRHFQLALIDPPVNAHDLEVAFALDAKAGPATRLANPHAAPAASEGLALRGALGPPAPEVPPSDEHEVAAEPDPHG